MESNFGKQIPDLYSSHSHCLDTVFPIRSDGWRGERMAVLNRDYNTSSEGRREFTRATR